MNAPRDPGPKGHPPEAEDQDPFEDVPVFEAEGWLLRVSDLKQYAYCPRVVYYLYNMPGVRPTTFKMDLGLEAQERVSKLELRRGLQVFGVREGTRHFHVTLWSGELGLSGQVDMVVEAQEAGRRIAIPVDFKMSRRKADRNVRLQVACYGLLLEAVWQVHVPRGYVYSIPLRRAEEVPMTARLKADARRLVAEVRAMIERQVMPPPTPQRARCVDCEFRRFCNDLW